MIYLLLSGLFGAICGWGVARLSGAKPSARGGDAEIPALASPTLDHLTRETRDLSNILNMLPLPVSQRDAEGRVMFCNLAFSEIAEEASSDDLPVAELECYPGQRTLALTALKDGSEQRSRRHIVMGGKRLLFEFVEIPLLQEKQTIGLAYDISELELAQEEIQRHISVLRDLLESSTAAMAMYGRDMRLKYFNMAFAALWKLEETWLDQEPLYGEILEALREKRKLPEHANFAAFKQAQLKLFTSLMGPDESFYYLPDGKILRAVAIPHALGGILLVYEDVTDRVALERSYNTLIAVQRETLDHLHEAVAVFGEDGRLRLCNPMFEKIWQLEEGFTRAEPHLRDWLECARALFIASNWESFCSDLIGRLQQRQYLAMRFDRADGSVIDCASVPLPDGATLVTFQDVTDSTLLERSLREKNEALEAADRVKTEFLANMSYELRSPLTSISGFAEMLSKSYIGPLNATQAEYVAHIYESSRHLSTLISAIIDLASIEAGYLQLDLASCDLSELLGQVCGLSGELVKSRGLSLHYAPAALPAMQADAMRLKQAFMQVISLLARYGKTGGELSVSAAQDAPDSTRIIFSAATRVLAAPLAEMIATSAATGARSATVSDLGMTMVTKLIAMHQGSIKATAEDSHFLHVEIRLPNGKS